MKNELLAPNGKPSNLNSMQYELVRTPAFKSWFGDWEAEYISNQIANPHTAVKFIDNLLPTKNNAIFSLPLVQRLMLGLAHNDKVFGSIVSFLPIDVVNGITREHIPSDKISYNLTVFRDSIDSPILGEYVSSLERAVTRFTTKLSSFINGGSNEVSLTALEAKNLDLSIIGGLSAFESIANLNRGDWNIKPSRTSSATKPSFSERLGNKNNGAMLTSFFDIYLFSTHREKYFDKNNKNLLVSQVKDENGEPKVCYHGTFSDNVNVFDEKKIGDNTGNEGHYGYGFYFSYSKIEASTYTYATNPIILECFLNIRNPFLSSDIDHLEKYAKDYNFYEEKQPVAIDSEWLESELKKRKDQKPYLLYKSIKENGYEKGWKLFLDKNKVDWDNETFDYNRINDWAEYDSSKEEFSKENEFENNNDEIPEHILEDISEQLKIPVSKIKTIKQYTIGNYPRLLYMMDLGNRSRSLTDEIKQDGFDGIIAGSEIVLFKSNQIKLANGKNVIFDSNNDDIRFEKGGEMTKDIRCVNCGWEWNKKDSELWDMYVCHKCGFDNTTFYTSITVNSFDKEGKTKTKSPNYLKMFLGK